MEVIALPAEGAVDAKERDVLRKELDEARKQGEAYARELAHAFTQGEGTASSSTFPPPMSQTPTSEPVATLVRFSGGVAAELRGLLSQVGRDVQALRAASPHTSSRALDAEGEDRIDGMKRRVREAQELVSELGSLGEIDPTEPQAEVDLVDLARSAVRVLGAQSERAGVDVRVVVVGAETSPVPARLSPRAAAFLVRTLVSQAIAATARGHEVVVTVQAEAPAQVLPPQAVDPQVLPPQAGDPQVLPPQAGDPQVLPLAALVAGLPPDTVGAVPVGVGARLLVDDAGASLPANARRRFVGLSLDPATYGRPTSVALFTCSELASWQGALLELGDAPAGGLRVGLHLPRFTAKS